MKTRGNTENNIGEEDIAGREKRSTPNLIATVLPYSTCGSSKQSDNNPLFRPKRPYYRFLCNLSYQEQIPHHYTPFSPWLLRVVPLCLLASRHSRTCYYVIKAILGCFAFQFSLLWGCVLHGRFVHTPSVLLRVFPLCLGVHYCA